MSCGGWSRSGILWVSKRHGKQDNARTQRSRDRDQLTHAAEYPEQVQAVEDREEAARIVVDVVSLWEDASERL